MSHACYAVGECVEHNIAHDYHTFSDFLCGEVDPRRIARAAAACAQSIGEHTIDLFRHVAHKAAKPRLNVYDPNSQLGRRESASKRRVRITIHQHSVRLLLQQYRLDALQHASGLGTVRRRADIECDVGCQDAEFVEEHIRHHRVVVLPSVHQNFRVHHA